MKESLVMFYIPFKPFLNYQPFFIEVGELTHKSQANVKL